MNTEVKTQTVQSYERKVQVKPEPTSQDMIPVIVLVAGATAVIALMFWHITLVVALIGLSWYVGSITVFGTPQTAPEQPTAVVEKPKRSYNKRIKVTHYQLGKVNV